MITFGPKSGWPEPCGLAEAGLADVVVQIVSVTNIAARRRTPIDINFDIKILLLLGK
jgi:hypothetical protein